MLISTPDFKFIDIQYFLAPGYSLTKFLKAYNADSQKSYFPYEYINTLDILNSDVFPPYDSFYSELRQVHVLEEESIQFNELIDRGYSEDGALRKMGLTNHPLEGFEKYDILSTMFYTNSWKLSDYLKYYNNLDVLPMISALENMRSYYNARSIEPFKNHLSVPSIAGK